MDASKVKIMNTREIQNEVIELLEIYPGLNLLPVVNELLRFEGTLMFSAECKNFGVIHDCYEIRLIVPIGYPKEIPLAFVTDGRVPDEFHTNEDGSLCLGSPIRIMLKHSDNSTLLDFTNNILIPYLYNYSYKEKYGVLPFGELAHGSKGLLNDYADLFCLVKINAVEEMIRLTSIKKRIANKFICPCGSGRLLGKCHNRIVNQYRDKLGRTWFRHQYIDLTEKSKTSRIFK